MFSTKNLALALTASFLSVAFALPIGSIRREVPQEHSHEQFLTTVRASLNLNNPDQIVDPVFGLLGDAAAAQGLGKITDPDCLQQATADQAFTNAKAATDVQGMTAALIYRALERNTGKVGLASVACTSIKAVNPEIAAIQQHQDPASPNAAAVNKAITLALAQQIAAIGGDPQDALKSGTFAPGNVNDNTGKGNTCDDANDATGCIFTQNLIVEDATAAEISAAVASSSSVAIPNSCDTSDDSASSSAAAAAATTVAASTADAASTAAVAAATAAATTAAAAATTAAAAAATTAAAAAATTAAAASTAAASTAAAAASTSNLQTFTGALGGVTPPPVTVGGRGFVVTNNSDFLTLSAALSRSCAVQHNACADAANKNKNAGFSVGDCDQQETQCNAA
ncbi:hypothetical protein M422DRAFT_242497 [Sphaerobolus stellatus SS14]|nr:hypothetical protein M422DRAFT_242497 [Sphaerobolus stellatus SS14]